MDTINDDYSPLHWLEPVSLPDPFECTFSTHESIMEVMNSDEIPWNDYDHRSSFLPAPDKIDNEFSTMFSPEIVDSLKWPISVLQDEFERNLGNISTMIYIDISVKERIIENIPLGASCSVEEIQAYKALFQEFRDIFSWSYKEMTGIDLSIVMHDIKTYPDAKPIR